MVIPWQSDSPSLFVHSCVPSSPLPRHSPSAAGTAGFRVQGKGPREQDGGRDEKSRNPLERETLTRLTSARLQKRIPDERARRVKAIVRK